MLYAQEVSSVHNNGGDKDVDVEYSLKNIVDKRCNTIMFLYDTDTRKCRKDEYMIGVLTEILGTRRVAVDSLKAMSLATASLGSNNATTQKLLFSPANQVNDSPRAREVVLISKDTVVDTASVDDEGEWCVGVDRVGLADSDRVVRAASKNKTIKENQERKNDFHFFLISKRSCLDTIRRAVRELSTRHGKPDVSMSLHVIKNGDACFASSAMAFTKNADMLTRLSNKFRGLIKNIIVRYKYFYFSLQADIHNSQMVQFSGLARMAGTNRPPSITSPSSFASKARSITTSPSTITLVFSQMALLTRPLLVV